MNDELFLMYGVMGETGYAPLEFGSKEVKIMRYSLFLHNSDFRVLQRIREEALSIEKTLSDEEYKELEESRQYAVEQIRALNQV